MKLEQVNDALRNELAIADVERQELTSSKARLEEKIRSLELRLGSVVDALEFKVAKLENELRFKTDELAKLRAGFVDSLLPASEAQSAVSGDEPADDDEDEVDGEVAEEVVPDEAVRAEADGGAVEARRSNQAAPALLHVEVENIEENGGQAENEDVFGKYISTI